jgi:signal transduction histidine kinase
VQNTELHERVQRAAANTASINEHFLRRISAELHDGPLQELSVALLRMDRVTNQNKDNLAAIPSGELLPPIQSSLTNAIQELRAIAAGFGLPQIDGLSLAEIVRRVVRAHEQRTADRVTSTIGNLPEEANLPMKIALYRVIQEALNNGHQHAKGMGLHVDVHTETGKLIVSISDRGPGFDVKRALDSNEHLGLLGMRERVESLGGHFEIQSIPFAGTTIRALLPLSQTGDNHAT